ncbi:MAG: hypothetical protein ACOCUT_01550 [bacterium]
MTKLMDEAINEIQKLPDSEQDNFAKWILDEIKSEKRWQELFKNSQEKLQKISRLADQEESEEMDFDKL